jgi:hypothetical protein
MKTPKRPKQFHRYKNVSGKSIVARYEIAKDGMTIRFTDHSVLRYTNQSAEPANISKMKTLALAGKGLGTFIEANLKERHLCKVR